MPDVRVHSICDKVQYSRTHKISAMREITGLNSVCTTASTSVCNILGARPLAQGVSRWSPTAEAKIWFQSGPCGICGK